MVHSKVYVPFTNPVTVVVLSDGVVIVGEFGPVSFVHNPVPGEGGFPAMVIVVVPDDKH
jgi:hypothetical protein